MIKCGISDALLILCGYTVQSSIMPGSCIYIAKLLTSLSSSQPVQSSGPHCFKYRGNHTFEVVPLKLAAVISPPG